MDLAQAAGNYRRAMVHATNLAKVHRRVGSGGAGRRFEEVSINRAIVVISVASWQAAIQDLTLANLDLRTPPPTDPIAKSYQTVANRTRTEVESFSTPNAKNARRLLRASGFDPKPHWSWSQPGGRGRPWVTLTPKDIDDRIDDWLKVRHAIAHGHEALPAVHVLQQVRASPTPIHEPSLRLGDAEACGALFTRLLQIASDALAGELATTPPSWTPDP